MNPVSSQELRQRLHDGLCQQITAALMFSDTLRRNLRTKDASEADVADCDKLVEILQASADEMIAVMNLLAGQRD